MPTLLLRKKPNKHKTAAPDNRNGSFASQEGNINESELINFMSEVLQQSREILGFHGTGPVQIRIPLTGLTDFNRAVLTDDAGDHDRIHHIDVAAFIGIAAQTCCGL